MISDIQRGYDHRCTDTVEWLDCKQCGELFFVQVEIGTNGNILDEGQPDKCPECRGEDK